MTYLHADRAADHGAVFPGDGEMARRCRALDWAATPLGPVSIWSASLRTTVGIVLTSRQPMFLWWGPELVQLYNDAYRPSLGVGGRADHALGARGRAFWTEIWEVIGPQIDDILAGGNATWHEDQFLPIERNGRLEDVWWTYSYSPVRDDDGRIGGVLVVCQETTRRIRAEQALATERAQLGSIIDQAPAFVAVLRGLDHRYERTNAEYDRLVGGRALPGLTVAEALPEVVAQGFIGFLDRVLATGVPFVGRAVEVQLVRVPGGPPERRYVDFVFQALTEADGTNSGVFVHGVDVTDAIEGRRNAEEANRAKSEFLAVMSHELRTPLNAIGGYAELIELGVHGPVTAEQRADLERIQRAQRHLLGLINGVLNYAKVDAGAVQYATDEVSLDVVLATCEALITPQVRAKGLTLEHAPMAPTADRAPLRVRADREKVQQILLNLLSNAVKFTEPRGRITLAYDLAPAESDVTRSTASGVVAIRVADTGIGIAADQLARAFEPFVQVDARLTRTREGTGLGLAISRDLARGMGGDITAESMLGVGSTFTLTLPAA